MITLRDLLLEKYPKNGNIADKWVTATGTPFSWESLTSSNLDRFAFWLCDDVAQSSAKNYTAIIKAIIEPFADEIDLPRNWRKFLTVKGDESEHTYLTEKEIQRIIDYVPDTLTEATVQQQFILGCLTGARHSDYSKFSESNISPTGNLVYVSQKTHVRAELPLSPVARKILFAKGDKFSGAHKRSVSDTTFNNTIRRICNMCDIDYTIQLYRFGGFWTGKKYEAISSHTSRRSFCTNLYLRCRDLMLVSKLAGHSSVSMTEHYVCCGLESMTDLALQYFEQF